MVAGSRHCRSRRQGCSGGRRWEAPVAQGGLAWPACKACKLGKTGGGDDHRWPGGLAGQSTPAFLHTQLLRHYHSQDLVFPPEAQRPPSSAGTKYKVQNPRTGTQQPHRLTPAVVLLVYEWCVTYQTSPATHQAPPPFIVHPAFLLTQVVRNLAVHWYCVPRTVTVRALVFPASWHLSCHPKSGSREFRGSTRLIHISRPLDSCRLLEHSFTGNS